MRRAVAIAFLLVFLLNVAGCYGIFWILLQRADTSMIQKLDAKAYDEGETVLIKVPLSLPYSVDDADYKRVNGTFQYQGEFYKLVKQKMQQDSLHVICIKDKHHKKIFDAMADFVKASHDASTASKTLKLLHNTAKEFHGFDSIDIISNRGWSQLQSNSKVIINYAYNVIHSPSPPPKLFIHAAQSIIFS
jgi:hypothetical protein